jgi:hypothetical protein
MPHSPAPFEYFTDVEMICDANGKRIADLSANENEDDCDIPTEAEGVANAKLFCAAPDVLATLVLAERLIHVAINVDAFKTTLRDGAAKIHHETIRAAIAKAKGEA